MQRRERTRKNRDKKYEMAKLALQAAPFDPDVWLNIGEVLHSTGEPTDATENTFFENAITYANLRPRYFFAYLAAKRSDFEDIQHDLGAGLLPKEALETVDDAVICPTCPTGSHKENDVCRGGIRPIFSQEFM